jgi:O-antigen/teichoic acid export membrane protein
VQTDIKHKAISGFFWQFGQKILSQGIQFVISVILARLLMPEEFGLVALTTIFINVAMVCANSGLGASLIQAKEVDEVDFNTAFFAGFGISVIIYGIIFFVAPYAADWYEKEELTWILRTLGLTILLSSLNSVQNAIVYRNLELKRLFKATIAGVCVSAAVGVLLAFYGFGVWALVFSSVSNQVTNILTMNLIIKWRPKCQFSIQRLKKLYSFGINIMATEFMGTFFNELRGFFIGSKYSVSDLAFYNRGNVIPSILSNNITGTMCNVLFPSMSKYQDDKETVKRMMRTSIKVCSFFVMPLMFFLFSVSDKVVLVLYSEKWTAAIPFMQVLCLKCVFSIVGGINIQAVKALGKSNVLLKLEFIKKPLYLGAILYAMTISPLAICIANTVYDFVGMMINILPNRKFLNYTYKEQFKDVVPYLLLSVAMVVVAIGVGHFIDNIYVALAVQLIVCVTVYLVLAHVFSLESYVYVVENIKKYRNGEIKNK